MHRFMTIADPLKQSKVLYISMGVLKSKMAAKMAIFRVKAGNILLTIRIKILISKYRFQTMADPFRF